MSKSVLKKKVKFDDNSEEPVVDDDSNEGYEADVQPTCNNEMEEMLVNHIAKKKEEK